MLQWPVLELSAVCLGKVKTFTHYFFFHETTTFQKKKFGLYGVYFSVSCILLKEAADFQEAF